MKKMNFQNFKYPLYILTEKFNFLIEYVFSLVLIYVVFGFRNSIFDVVWFVFILFFKQLAQFAYILFFITIAGITCAAFKLPILIILIPIYVFPMWIKIRAFKYIQVFGHYELDEKHFLSYNPISMKWEVIVDNENSETEMSE